MISPAVTTVLHEVSEPDYDFIWQCHVFDEKHYRQHNISSADYHVFVKLVVSLRLSPYIGRYIRLQSFVCVKRMIVVFRRCQPTQGVKNK